MILCFALVELYNQEEKERDCNMQFDRQNGGNKTLDPEESKSFTAGLVFEPIKNLAFTRLLQYRSRQANCYTFRNCYF